MQERPIGVTILAVLAIVAGVFGFFAAIALLLGGSMAAVGSAALAPSSGTGAAAAAGFGFMAVLTGLFTLVVAVAEVVFGLGALQLKPWAWMIGIASQALGILNILVSMISGRSGFGGIVSLAICGAILWYLFTPEVKRAFGRD